MFSAHTRKQRSYTPNNPYLPLIHPGLLAFFIYFYQHEVTFLRLKRNWIICPPPKAVTTESIRSRNISNARVEQLNEIIKHLFNKSIHPLVAVCLMTWFLRTPSTSSSSSSQFDSHHAAGVRQESGSAAKFTRTGENCCVQRVR